MAVEAEEAERGRGRSQGQRQQRRRQQQLQQQRQQLSQQRCPQPKQEQRQQQQHRRSSSGQQAVTRTEIDRAIAYDGRRVAQRYFRAWQSHMYDLAVFEADLEIIVNRLEWKFQLRRFYSSLSWGWQGWRTLLTQRRQRSEAAESERRRATAADFFPTKDP